MAVGGISGQAYSYFEYYFFFLTVNILGILTMVPAIAANEFNYEANAIIYYFHVFL